MLDRDTWKQLNLFSEWKARLFRSPSALQKTAELITTNQFLSSTLSAKVSVLEPPTPPPPILPRNLQTSQLRFLDFEPLEVARQMTLVEAKLFRKITTEEFWHYCSGRFDLAPNISTMIRRLNHVSFWVASEILREQDCLVERALVLSRFIDLGRELEQLHNYNGVMEIVGALNLSAITRLKETWKLVSQKNQGIFQALDQLVSTQGGFSELRTAIESSQTACVPFPGVFIMDVNHLGEAPSLLSCGCVNFRKMRGFCKVKEDLNHLKEKKLAMRINMDSQREADPITVHTH